MLFADVQSIREMIKKAQENGPDIWWDGVIEMLDAAADRIEELESDIEYMEEKLDEFED